MLRFSFKNGISIFRWFALTLFILLLLFLFVGQVFLIPTPSMLPTLEIGDRVFVSKYSYGIRPYSFSNRFGFGRDWRLAGREPRRGDIVVVRNPREDAKGIETLVIKRVVGLPGDDIRMRDGRLEIRTQPVKLTMLGPATSTSEPQIARGGTGFYMAETFPSEWTGKGRAASTHTVLDLGVRRDDNFGPFTVPEGSMFLLGDNRDNSTDSRNRYLGVVPFDNLVGRAQFVIFSWKNGKDVGFPLRFDRFFKPLR